MLSILIRRTPNDHEFGNVAAVKAALILAGSEAADPILPGDEALWILGAELEIEVDGHEDIVVPIGFTTDGASVPPVAQWVTRWHPWSEPQRSAGIVHDWLYHQPRYDRKRADRIFRAMLEKLKADPVRSRAMYAAVRLFGGPAYRRNQRWGWRSRIFD